MQVHKRNVWKAVYQSVNNGNLSIVEVQVILNFFSCIFLYDLTLLWLTFIINTAIDFGKYNFMFPSSEGLQLCFQGNVNSVPQQRALSITGNSPRATGIELMVLFVQVNRWSLISGACWFHLKLSSSFSPRDA